MKDLVRAEFRKLSTTRSALGLLAALVGIMVLGVAVTMLTMSAEDLSGPLHELPLFQSATFVFIFVYVLGVRSFTDEFRYGTITPALLVDPSRARLVAAKTVVMGAAGLLFSLAASVTILFLAVPWLAIKGAETTVTIDGLVGVVAGSAVAAALWSLIGVGVGAALRQQVSAIVGGLVWLMVGETLAAQLMPHAAKYLPGQAANALAVPAQPLLLAVWTGALMLAMYSLVSLAVAARAFAGKDI
jgi:ABC-2 type transport system permease protein